MKDGFWHVKLHEESSRLCTFNTPFGLYSFCRLPFSIMSASVVFEKVTETFGDIDSVHDTFVRKLLDNQHRRSAYSKPMFIRQ